MTAPFIHVKSLRRIVTSRVLFYTAGTTNKPVCGGATVTGRTKNAPRLPPAD